MTSAYEEEKEITWYAWNKPQTSFSVIVIIIIIIFIAYLRCADSILFSVPFSLPYVYSWWARLS